MLARKAPFFSLRSDASRLKHLNYSTSEMKKHAKILALLNFISSLLNMAT